MMAQRGLGKGLEGAGLGAFFGEDVVNESQEAAYLPVSRIEPREGQPRVRFDEEALAELADSIGEHGLIQPVTVRPLDGGYYQIIAGERRWRAARMAGLTEIPVRILQADDRKTAELALVENLQREDLNPVEEARGYRSLMEAYGMTQESAAAIVGKSRPVVANALRLLNLPDDVLEMVEDGTLTLSHARAILELTDPGMQSEAAKQTKEKQLSVRDTTALVKRMMSGNTAKGKKARAGAADGVDYYAEVEKDLTRALGRKVRISAGAKKGRFEIEYYDAEDFENLYEALLQAKPRKGGRDK